ELFHSAQSGFLRDVSESSIPIVVKQPALAIRRDEQIVVPIVVVIADGNADAVHLQIEARFVRHIGERSVVIVVIELWRRMLRDVARPVHSVDEENIRPSVVVVIDESHARSNRLRQKLFSKRAIVVCETNSSFRRDIYELNASLRALRIRGQRK